jgi:import inner membrane translocase subunit TIM50
MLARALNRSLQMPRRPAAVPAFRIASTQWTRNLASNNNRRGPPKKPIDYTRLQNGSSSGRPSSVGPQRSSGATGSGNAQSQRPSPASSKGDPASRMQYSKRQDELNERITPESKATSPSGAKSASGAAKHDTSEDSSFPGAKEESRTTASPSGNTVPEDSTPIYSQIPDQPLPDLTRGIPSTLDYETMGSTSPIRPEGMSLNLTEDPKQDSSGGRRGRGELPASAYVSSSEKKRLRVANYLYASFAAFSILGYMWLGRNWDTEEEELQHPDAPSGWSLGLMWSRFRARTGGQLDYYKKPAFEKLLPDPDPAFSREYTLVLSLEDLLIHSEWSRDHGWRMAKRPGVDYFLRYLSQYYELVIFTSQPWAIGEPVIRKLDPYHIVTWPLYREATFYKNGEYVKVSGSVKMS